MRIFFIVALRYLFIKSVRRGVKSKGSRKRELYIAGASPCILAAAERQMIGTTMRRVDWGCRSSSESAANSSGLISAIIPSPWRYARVMILCIRKYGREEERKRNERGREVLLRRYAADERERKLLLGAEHPPSSRRWPSTFAPKSRLGQTAGHAPVQVAPSHGWMVYPRTLPASAVQFHCVVFLTFRCEIFSRV